VIKILVAKYLETDFLGARNLTAEYVIVKSVAKYLVPSIFWRPI